jgi:molecular chaperone HtpG
MSTEAPAEKHEFQAETRQLLRLMIHSLYSNKEIFLRELISNASDAADKLRFLAIQTPTLLGDGEALAVDLIIDKDAGTLTVRDNGVGMSRQEVIDNLGTIARSGTKQFMESLSSDGRKDAQLIGQFGVGFYSAFIVADRVTVLTRRAGEAEGWRWSSDGEGSYTLEAGEKATHGTEVTLHLREDDKEYLEEERVRWIVRKYSDHISLPVRLQIGDGEAETLNRAAALWTRPKAELTPEDYTSFYTHLSHDPAPPLAWAHHRVEGNTSYISLLYVPSVAPMDYGSATVSAASSSTSNAYLFSTKGRNCCRLICVSCAAWSIPTTSHSMFRANCCRTIEMLRSCAVRSPSARSISSTSWPKTGRTTIKNSGTNSVPC